MTPREIFRRRAWFVAVGFAAIIVLWYAGAAPFPFGYSRSQASATPQATYATVLAQIKTTDSFQGILTLAGNAGLVISTSSDSGAGVQTALITAPHTNTVLAAVTEYTDALSLSASAPTSTPIIHPICPSWGCGREPILPTRPSLPIAPVPATPPTLSLSASPASVTIGESSMLTWSSANATACVASGAWSGAEALSGTLAQPSTAVGLRVYTLICTGAGGSITATTSIVTYPVLSVPIGRPAPRLVTLLFIPAAYAQTTGGVSTVVGNNTGSFATCSIAGSNGQANVMVYPNGQIYGISGNYNFSLGDGLTGGSNSSLGTAASAAVTAINTVGGPQATVTQSNNSNNQITAVVNTNASTLGVTDNVTNGLSVNIDEPQDDGSYDDSCTANILVGNMSSAETGNQQYVTSVFEHEVLHCLGLDHSNVPGDTMNPSAPDSSLNLNDYETQYLKDIAAGNTIQVDSNSCTASCTAGTVWAAGSRKCVSQTDLCSPQSNTVWNTQTQSCESCPIGTHVATISGIYTCVQTICIPPLVLNQQTNQCAQPSCPTGSTYDSMTLECAQNPPTCTPSSEGSGAMTCTYENGTSCSCKSSGTVECSDTDGNTVTPPTGACQGSCSGGQIQQADGSCIANCTLNPSNPSCAASNACEDVDSAACASYCATNPNDPSCPTSSNACQSPDSDACQTYCANNPNDSACTNNGDDYCTQNPTDPDCQNYCATNPDDPSCTGSGTTCSPDDSSCSITTDPTGGDGGCVGEDNGGGDDGGGDDSLLNAKTPFTAAMAPVVAVRTPAGDSTGDGGGGGGGSGGCW